MADYKFIKTHKALYEYFKTLIKGFDINGSLRLTHRYSFVCEGVIYRTRNLPFMLDTLNQIAGKELFDVKSSSAKGRFSYMIFTGTGDVVNESALVEKVDEPIVEDAEVIEDTVVDETVPDVTEAPTVDWNYVESIENSKEGKLELDEYAATFDVKLSRVKSLANMIIDFKEAINA